MLGLGLDQLWRITPQEYLALQREQQHLCTMRRAATPRQALWCCTPQGGNTLPPDVEREEQDMMAQARAMFYGGDVPCG